MCGICKLYIERRRRRKTLSLCIDRSIVFPIVDKAARSREIVLHYCFLTRYYYSVVDQFNDAFCITLMNPNPNKDWGDVTAPKGNISGRGYKSPPRRKKKKEKETKETCEWMKLFLFVFINKWISLFTLKITKWALISPKCSCKLHTSFISGGNRGWMDLVDCNA